MPPTVSPAEALKQGFRYISGNPWPRALITIIAAFAIFGFSFMTMMPVFARDALHLGASGYGAMVSSVGLGAAVAALFMAAAGGRVPQPLLVLGSSISFGLILTAGGIRPRLRFGGGAVHNVGMRDGAQWHRGEQHAPGRGARPPPRAGHGILLLRRPRNGAPRLVPGGWLAEHFGVRIAVALGGGFCFIVAAIVTWRMLPLAPMPTRA